MHKYHAAANEDYDLIVMRRSDLFELLGEFALPPWLDGSGGEVDCSSIAQELIQRIEALEW